MSRVDETKIIDREAEAMIFSEMIQLRVPRCIMVVSDKSGMGKTDLLRKRRLQCERDHGVAVALAPLEEFVGRQDEFVVVDCLQRALAKTGASFQKFDELNSARLLNDMSRFAAGLRELAGAVDARQASITGDARIAGMMINADYVNISLPQWNDEFDVKARKLCTDAFLVDLFTYVEERPVALLFDSLEKVGESLRNWVINDLVRRRALAEGVTCKLVVVFAGEDIAGLVYGQLPQDLHEQIEPIASFADWSVEQVAEFLAAHGYVTLQDREIAAIHALLGAQHTLINALALAAMLVQMRQAA